jgi:hypothetical protein
VFFAVVPRPCSGVGETACEVGDGTGPIDREVVAAGIEQDCVAFNQYVGAGFNAVPGYVTGECFGVATVRVSGRLARVTRRAPRHCRVGQPRSTDRGPAPPPIVAPARAAAAIAARTPDPWHRAPNTGSVGDRPLFVPPWALLLWRGRDGSRCYEPGQYVDARRFNPHPRAEGGRCGDPDGPAGLIFSWETEVARRDLNLAVTTVAGIVGRRVRSVEVIVDGRARALAITGGAFLGVFRGDVAPRDLPITVRYRDGATRVFRAQAGRVAR